MALGPILLSTTLLVITLFMGIVWLNSRKKNIKQIQKPLHHFHWITKEEGIFEGVWYWQKDHIRCQIFPLIDATNLMNQSHQKNFLGVMVKIESQFPLDFLTEELSRCLDNQETWDQTTLVYKKEGIPFHQKSLAPLMKELNQLLTKALKLKTNA